MLIPPHALRARGRDKGAVEAHWPGPDRRTQEKGRRVASGAFLAAFPDLTWRLHALRAAWRAIRGHRRRGADLPGVQSPDGSRLQIGDSRDSVPEPSRW